MWASWLPTSLFHPSGETSLPFRVAFALRFWWLQDSPKAYFAVNNLFLTKASKNLPDVFGKIAATPCKYNSF